MYTVPSTSALVSDIVFIMSFNFALRKHAYASILKILPPKNENFQVKNSDVFIFLHKT